MEKKRDPVTLHSNGKKKINAAQQNIDFNVLKPISLELVPNNVGSVQKTTKKLNLNKQTLKSNIHQTNNVQFNTTTNDINTHQHSNNLLFKVTQSPILNKKNLF